jgi:hypothetical protein
MEFPDEGDAFDRLKSIAASFTSSAASAARRNQLTDLDLKFKEDPDLVIEFDFDPDEAVMCMKDNSFVGKDYDEVFWDEKSEEEIPVRT